jgi:hypothetical protein
MRKQASEVSHDIFLSHAFDDRELALGIALTLEFLGYTVYLDWRDDPLLDRKNVTPSTAVKLRARMTTSKCLFYAVTEHATNSKWMPWELGYKDGQSRRSAILPIRDQVSTSYSGQEYLGIYPYVVQQINRAGSEKLWIHSSSNVYVVFDEWLKGEEPTDRS